MNGSKTNWDGETLVKVSEAGQVWYKLKVVSGHVHFIRHTNGNVQLAVWSGI